MKLVLLIVATIFSSLTAQAGVYSLEVTSDAHDLKVVEAKYGQVQTGEKAVPNGNYCGPDDTINCGVDVVPTFENGLNLVFSYTGHNAGSALDNEGNPYPVDSATVELGLPGEHALVAAKIVRKTIEKDVLDDDASIYCDRDNEGNKRDPNCEDKDVMKRVSVEATVIEVTTK